MIRAVFTTHLRLALRGWGFWVLLLGGLAMTALATRDSTSAGMLGNFAEMVFPLFLLGQMLLTTAAAGQEQSDRVHELVEAMPYRPGVWVLGRYAAHLLIWLAASALLWLTGALMLLLGGEIVDGRLLLISWAVIAPASTAFGAAVAFLAAAHVRSALAYLVSALVWAAGPFLGLILSKEAQKTPVPVWEFFASGRSFGLSPIGFFPNGLLLLYNRLFVIGVAVAGLALIVWLTGRRRSTPARRAAVAAVLGALLVVGSYAGAAQIWHGRLAVIAAEQKLAPTHFTETSKPFVIGKARLDRYDLQLQLSTAEHRMAVTAAFDVTNPGTERLPAVELSLRSTFGVQRVTAGGKPVPYSREGHRLRLELPLAPGEQVRVTVAYAGEVWQWRWEYGPRLAAHIAPQTLLLPASYLWYPIAGHATPEMIVHQCSGPGENCVAQLRDWYVAHPPATFALTVEGWEQNLVSNQGERTTGLFLVGTPNPTKRLGEAYGNIEITVSPANQARAERIAGHAASRIAQYESVVPLGRPTIRIIETPDSTLYGQPWSGRPSLATHGLLLHHREIGSYTSLYATGKSYGPDAISAIWWPSELTMERYLFDGAARYMEELLFGLALPDVDTDHPNRRGPTSDQVVKILRAVQKAGGREAVAQVLQELRSGLEQGGPTTAQFTASVNRVAGDAPGLAELLAALAVRR